ncbi:hypothetical protein LX64_03400 [Chitinophaga skermanii]|uniref:DNA-binding beta-propeller fold protein YncE n=1 Tax=Chitinophaga skermanii TaxID=331697 RepID=A0A327QET7_9BACT|nr:DUF5074 domain-containing protein [Chitinophaga skermanii]RAJ02388.1 hypothetical protein LX64_03400 [Chitinophaga skermanii]
MRMKKYALAAAALGLVYFSSCRTEDTILPPTVTPVDTPSVPTSIIGFYLLNEGNMGSNKASLDYYDYTSGLYKQNIYAEANPTAVKELGDVGNDIRVYGSKVYAVINVSNRLEIMDVATAKRVKTVEILNCRYVTFANGKAYISSYAGPVELDPNAPIGKVIELDTATLNITREVIVGYQPEEMAIVGNNLYVANSGGYRFPNYDSTVSVVDLASFKEIKKINVAINLHRLKADNRGNLYVSSRGDYYTKPSRLFKIDTKTNTVVKQIDFSVSNLAIAGDTAYLYGTEFNYNTGKTTIAFNMLDLKTDQLLNKNFITDGTDKGVKMPYGIAINPITKEIFLTDAKDYVSPGTLYCFGADGVKKWSVTTGDIPAHFAFVYGVK